MADRQVLRVTRLLWSALRRDNPRLTATVVAVDLLTNIAGRPLLALWLKLVVDGVSRGNRSAVTVACVGLAGSIALQGAAASAVGTLFNDLHESSARILIGDLMRLSAGIPGIEHHERPEIADRIALLRSEGRVLTSFVSTLGSSVALAVRIVVIVLLLASVHPALLALPLLAVPSVWAGARATGITEAAREATAERFRLEDHLFGLATKSGPAKEARVYGLAAELMTRERTLWNEVADETAAAALRAALLRVAGWLVFAAGYVAAIALAVAQASRGGATPGDVLLVIALAGDVNTQVGRVSSLADRSAGTFRAVGRLLWLTDYAEAARAPVPEPAPVPERLHTGISFDGVGFRYPGTEHDVLTGLDVSLAAGSVVAVVGENGAGKTTLVKLLTRCYEPTSGRIRVDGTDLHRLDVDEWRRRLSAGFQDFARFELCLRESVGIGDLDRIEDADEVQRALERAQAADLAATLSRGIETQLGRQFPGGTELSEGQWQKVAIARALMAASPLLLVLDEPTSGLDATAEHALFERWAAAASDAARAVGTITLLISHRFSTVRLADLILVVDQGRLVEQGSHEALLAQGGLYAELYGIQARAYQ